MTSTTPLDGLLVADFSRVLAGPLAAMTLADLGATVVKVERPGAGDETRSWGPPWTARSSAYFECVNRGKYGLALDLADDADRGVALELASRADVLVENFRSGALARHGLDYETVSAGNPGVVYCSISGFGSAAGAARPGYDFLVQALGGLMSITGEQDGEPHKVGVALVDVLTGKDAVIGILAALAGREATGRGDHVQVDLLSSLLGGLVNQAASFLTTGVAPARMGNQHPSIAPYETLHCADGLIAIACGNDGQFRTLATTLDVAALADDPRFAANPARVAHRADLIAALEERLATNTTRYWEQRLNDAGVAAGSVRDIAGAFELATQLGLAPTIAVDATSARQVRHPVRYRRGAVARATAPPDIDEHGEVVRRWLAAPGGERLPRPDALANGISLDYP